MWVCGGLEDVRESGGVDPPYAPPGEIASSIVQEGKRIIKKKNDPFSLPSLRLFTSKLPS